MPRPGQGHGAIDEVEIAQVFLPLRSAKAEGERRLALAAEFDAIQRLAFGVEKSDSGTGSCLVKFRDDLKQTQPGGGHTRHRCLSGVLDRDLDAAIAPPLKVGALGQSRLPRKSGRPSAVEHDAMRGRKFFRRGSAAKKSQVAQRRVVGHLQVKTLRRTLQGNGHHTFVALGHHDSPVLTADLIRGVRQPRAATIVGRQKRNEAQPDILLQQGLAGLLGDAVGRTCGSQEERNTVPLAPDVDPQMASSLESYSHGALGRPIAEAEQPPQPHLDAVGKKSAILPNAFQHALGFGHGEKTGSRPGLKARFLERGQRFPVVRCRRLTAHRENNGDGGQQSPGRRCNRLRRLTQSVSTWSISRPESTRTRLIQFRPQVSTWRPPQATPLVGRGACRTSHCTCDIFDFSWVAY